MVAELIAQSLWNFTIYILFPSGLAKSTASRAVAAGRTKPVNDTRRERLTTGLIAGGAEI
jgi:hypothetical protein